MLKPGMVLNERYEIEKSIGEGGMAVVYKAKDHKLHREVAIKVLRPELSADEVVLSKFRKEGLNAASLSHNNIVGVYDLGRQDGSDYIVMEYIDGITLKEYIERRKKLTNDEIFKISVKIADALKAAHTNNIIHRDIKPQNIMVTPKGVVKVTDFGIAKATTVATMTAQGEAMGSVHYFSPEQARGKSVDARSDLYSLGITMFEMATSRLPFEGDTPVATAMKQIHDPLPDIPSLNPDIWPGLVGVIVKLTNKQPEERYQTADEVLEDLKRVYQNHYYVPDGKAVYKEYVPPVEPGQTSAGVPVPEEGEEEDEKKYTGLFIGLGIIAAALIGMIGFLLYNMFLKPQTSSVRPDSSVTIDAMIPTVVGHTEEEARAIAEKEGYAISVRTRDYNDAYDKGVIFEQSPVSGTPAEKETLIIVSISLGEYDAATVPDLSGASYNDAVRLLNEQGIAYQVEAEASEEVEMGVLIRQEPEEGTEVTEDTIVTLVVSSGSENSGVEVPDLAGSSREEANKDLKKAGLALGEVSLSYHESVPSGEVIAQDIEPGSLVPEGTEINITISQGAPGWDEFQSSGNGTILITNPLPENTESGHLSIEAVSSNGTSSGLYDEDVTQDTFAYGGLEISYPTGTVKIRVYLDGEELFVRDIN